MNARARLPHVALLTVAALGWADLKSVNDSDVRLAERRYDDAVTSINEAAAMERAAEAVKVAKVCRATMDAAMKAGDLDLAVAMREEAKAYEALGGARISRPENQLEFGGHSYALIQESVTWHVAKQRCEAMGGYLVCVETPEEDRFIDRICQGSHVWLGGTDEEKEGEWRWVNGQPMTYKNRAFAYVFDNAGGIQHHLHFAPGGLWDDVAGGDRHFFICEWGR